MAIHKVVGNENVTVHWCITEWDKEVYGQIYGVYMFVAILVLPLCLMVFAYSCICHRVWILHKQRPTLAQQSYQLRELEPCTSTRKGTSTVVTVTKKNYIVLSEYHTRQQALNNLQLIPQKTRTDTSIRVEVLGVSSDRFVLYFLE
ncbi:hypothetical protein ACF0H5_005347 [Mactra antiquata]